MSYIKEASKNRQSSIKSGQETYSGGCCRYCGQKERFTRRTYCATCYTDTGVAKNFSKRKHQLVTRLKSQAAFKNIKFDITEDDVEWSPICPILGIEINYFSLGGSKANTASFDRKDPSQGYIKGNVFIISNRANMIKSDMTIAQLERMITYVNG